MKQYPLPPGIFAVAPTWPGAGHGLELGLAFGLAEADYAVAIFPLTTFFEQFNALETLQNIAFRAQSAGATETRMLCHK